MPQGTTRRRALGALVLLTALALGLRLWHLDARLPAVPEPDDVVVTQALHLEDQRLGRRSKEDAINSQYPLLLAHLLEALPGELVQTVPVQAPLSEHLSAAAEPHRMGRRMVVGFSLLLIPGSYLLARRFLGRGPSLFAAALVATSLLHCLYSQQARPHVPLATLGLWAVLACQRLVRRGSVPAYLWAGLMTSAAVACLHNGFALLLPLGLALLLRWPRERGLARLLAVLPLGLVGLSIDLAYPTLLGAGSDLGFDKPEGSFFLSGHRIDSININGRGFLLVLGYLWGHDPLMVLLGGLGLALLLGRARSERLSGVARRDLWIALAFALPYLLVIGLYARTFGRFLLPLLPYAALLAAAGAALALRRLPALAPPRRAAVAGLLALAFPLAQDIQLERLRSRSDTNSQVASFLTEHADPSQDLILLGNWVSLPLAEPRRSLLALPKWSLSVWQRYQLMLQSVPCGRALRFIRPLTVTSMFSPKGIPHPEMQMALLDQLQRGVYQWVIVCNQYDLNGNPGALQPVVEEFCPPTRSFGYPPRFVQQEDPEGYSLDGAGWTWLWRREYLGPLLELRDLRRSPGDPVETTPR